MPFNRPEVHALPDKLLGQIIHNLRIYPNETEDFGEPHLRQSLASVYPLFLFLYGALVVVGTAGNVVMVSYILHRRLYRDPTCAFIMNIGLCHLIMSLLVLPLSLAILLIQNWIFGSFLCYFIPMLQDVPIHATIATLVFLALDRYLLLVRPPPKTRVPPFIAVLAVWVLSVCIVLPYAVYMNYIDLEVFFGKQFEGVGICTVNLSDDIDEYIRGLFVAMYVLPLGIAAFLHVRVSGEIKSQDAPVNLSTLDSRDPDSLQEIYTLQDTRRRASRTFFQESDRSGRSHYHENSAILGEMDGREEYLLHGGDSHQLPSFLTHSSSTRTTGTETPVGGHPPLESSSQVDLTREKRTHKYMVTITASIALCFCPLMILRLVKNMVLETYDNSGHFDITFITFVWIAFLPIISTPALFAAWRMPRSTKERLEGYLRFSNRSHRSSHSQHLPPTNIHHYHHPRADYRVSLEHPQAPPSSSGGGGGGGDPPPVSPHSHSYTPVSGHDHHSGSLRQEVMSNDLLQGSPYADQQQQQQQQRPQSLVLTS